MSLVLAITLSLTGALVATARPARASKHRKNRKPKAKPARAAAAPAGPEAAEDEPAQSPPSGMVDTSLDFQEPKERFPRHSGIRPTREAKELLREHAAALGPCDIDVPSRLDSDGRPKGPLVNLKRAIEGALKGDPGHQLQVAVFYDCGLALAKDKLLAMAWILAACDAGEPHAYLAYGSKLIDGKDVPLDVDKGVEMTMLACQKGFPVARVNLWMSHKHNGKPGFDLAYAQLKLAAEEGYEDAMYRLGVCHVRGEGVPVNRELGLKWLRKAERRGWRPAMEELTRLGEHLTTPKASISGIWGPRPIFK
jgi:TPR repeat protein